MSSYLEDPAVPLRPFFFTSFFSFVFFSCRAPFLADASFANLGPTFRRIPGVGGVTASTDEDVTNSASFFRRFDFVNVAVVGADSGIGGGAASSVRVRPSVMSTNLVSLCSLLTKLTWK